MQQRLDKFISNQLNISRQGARKLIYKGMVEVDGVTVKIPDTKIDTNICIVSANGENISYKEYVYIMLNKPKGVISASTDSTRQTIVDLIPERLRRKNLSPVGRLDKDTTGLIFLTDDGDFSHHIISPKSKITKEYYVRLDGSIAPNVVQEFEKGLTLADGTSLMPAKLTIDSSDNTCATVEILEGKYHQIKRMFGVVDLGVNELHRNRIGSVILDDALEPGECRELTLDELYSLYKKHNNS